MSEFLKVRPANGLTILDPETMRPLPAGTFTEVAATPFWLRRAEEKAVEILATGAQQAAPVFEPNTSLEEQ